MKIDRVNNINYLDNNIKLSKDLSNDIKKDEIVNIEISDTAKALVNRINQSNDIEISEKVEKIRQSIISGKYKVSSEEIANKLMELIDSQEGNDFEW